MADYTVDQIKQAIRNADRAGDSTAVRALGKRLAEMSRQPWYQSALSGFERGVKPVAEAVSALDPTKYVSNAMTDYFMPSARQRIEKALAAQAQQAQQQNPNWFTAGNILGEVAATAPLISLGGAGLADLGGVIASRSAPGAIRSVARATQQVGRATQRGGIGVRGVTRGAVKKGAPVAGTRSGRMGLRVAGGAISGGAGAALTDKDVTDAMLSGSVVPVAGTIARRGLGGAYDFLTRRVGEVKAAQILRNLITDKSSGIIEALKNAPKNIQANTAEFLASKGLLTPELAAATRIVSAGKASKPLERVAQARAAEQNAMRATIRGGETQTEAMGNIGAAKQQVRAETEPQRIEQLGLADIGRTQILPAERQAAASTALAKELEDNARRLTGSAVYHGESPMFTKGADVASYEAGRAADDARDAAQVAANLRAQGLQPLDVSGVISKLRTLAADAEDVAPDRANVFSSFADALARRATKFGGVIDATGLHLARREMGQFVASILRGQGADPKSIQLGTAQLVGEAQPLIDDAITAAGGKGWRDYLDAFSQGMRNVERKDFARKLTALPEARYAKVMSGGDPEYVAEHFGPGRFDINVELTGPEGAAAQRLATDITAQRAVQQIGLENLGASQRLALPSGAQSRVVAAFEPGVANIFARGLSKIAGGFPGLYGGGQFASAAEQELTNKLYESTITKLAPALARPSAANRLLGIRSASDYLGAASDYAGAMPQSFAAQTATRNMTAPLPSAPAAVGIDPNTGFPEIDPVTGETLVGVGNFEGRPFPIYGPLKDNPGGSLRAKSARR
jgi:hypothetical protein